MSHKTRSFTLTVLLLAFGVFWSGPSQARNMAVDATKFIEGLSNEFVTALHTDRDVPAREQRIGRLLRRGLDFDFMSRFVLGNHWRSAKTTQQAQFREVFTNFVVQAYARRLADGEITNFSLISARQTENGDVVVEAAFDRPDGPAMTFGFRVRDVGQQLKVIDVSVEGASLLLAQRSDFTLVVENQGIDALIAALRQKLVEH